MAKVHPKASGAAAARVAVEEEERERPATVLTVWRKSLLFNCDGFTVYDSATGDLAFRVDSYGSSSGRSRREDVVLMDAAGKPLLTVRRKARLLGPAHWVIYEGDAAAAGSGSGSAKPLLSVRCHGRRGGASDKAVAHVTRLAAGAEAGDYVVEGSYGRRSLAVRGGSGTTAGAVVAEVRRKEAVVGDDVFRLVVPAVGGMGAATAMGVVIALDQMFPGGSSRPSSLLPRRWSA
ncbi:protein LURP-one-related 8 [Brachypodium distachyon]|uniref:Protein LURP-one-related 8 n=1 Tax=Brachypodium distachyon TaxID=15368 RepID=I1IUY2_BRADI|nr:protein LURP-one-related 8 [Brachypodium distachyon]KQJ92516.1 hypothetical protein BRADI_4g44200v3 [Brachypodium distachyon]|eukprot:XP_003577127.1 protein LURP-one-related 8 [Brachypodium distachyon]